MLKLFLKPLLVVGIGMTGVACQPAPTGYGNPYYNSGYYSPAPARYAYSQPWPSYNYAYPRGNYGWYNQADGRGYTTVTVTNRGQHGNRDDVVRQRVACGSQYYDGYRQRTARC